MNIGDWFGNMLGGFAGMIASVVEKIGKAAVWMLTVVVIPMTVWFIALRSDVDQLKQKEIATKNEILLIAEQVGSLRDSTDKGFQDVSRSLGRVEGELRRIK